MGSRVTRIEYDRYGGPEEMRLREATLPQPRGHQVRVRVHAAAINPIDWRLREGEMKMMHGWKFPRAVGSDLAGIVESVGSEVSRFRVGDEVVGTTPFKTAGALAALALTDEKLLVPKPGGLSFAEAATLPIPAVTAWEALIHTAKLSRGQHVFINGALGSVGRAAIAIARDVGASVSGTVGKDKVDEGLALGLSAAMDYRRPIPVEHNHKYDVVLDCHGGLSTTHGKSLLSRNGIVVHIHMTWPKLWRSLILRRHKIAFFTGKTTVLQKIVDLAASGIIKIPIHKKANMNQAIPAIASLERGERLGGKVVIVFDEA
jgi:NADPH:quinone reductase-like Zn-dependent oxidoreductase